MTLTVEAVYKNGVLKLNGLVPLKDQELVEVTIRSKGSWVDETAGIIGWQGSHEELRYSALDPDLDHEEGT